MEISSRLLAIVERVARRDPTFAKGSDKQLIADAREVVAAYQAQRTNGVSEWRCFHCDQVFTDSRSASMHFGVSEDQEPACLIKGSDGGLVHALRATEEALFTATSALHSESADGVQAYRGHLARYNAAVRAAEEAGYARGLADARFEMSQ